MAGFELDADDDIVDATDDTAPRTYNRMAAHTPIPPGPCDGCWRAPQCKIYLLACGAFGDFVERGRFAANASRDASHWRFQRIFKSDPDADAQALDSTDAAEVDITALRPASYAAQRVAEINAGRAA